MKRITNTSNSTLYLSKNSRKIWPSNFGKGNHRRGSNFKSSYCKIFFSIMLDTIHRKPNKLKSRYQLFRKENHFAFGRESKIFTQQKKTGKVHSTPSPVGLLMFQRLTLLNRRKRGNRRNHAFSARNNRLKILHNLLLCRII